MRGYRMSISATVYFMVEADSEEEAISKAREVERAFPSPQVIDLEHEHIEVGDVELYVDHDVEGPQIEDVFDDEGDPYDARELP